MVGNLEIDDAIQLEPDAHYVHLRCMECGCVNISWPENAHPVIQKGYGMRVRDEQCIRYGNCYCHTGIGKAPTRIIMKKEPLG